MLPARLQKLKFFKDRTKSKDLLKTKPFSISNLFFFPAAFLPTLISTFAKSQCFSQCLFCKKADFFHRFLVRL